MCQTTDSKCLFCTSSCCEFLPARPEGSLDALKCVVCNCHCNFHRKEATLPPNAISVGALVPVTAISFGDAYPPYNYHSRQAPPPPQHALYPSALVLILAPGGGGGGKDHDSVRDIDNGGVGSCSNSKKRSRTKFTREQKGKMPAFAE